METTCKLCQKEFLMTRDLSNHIRIFHNLNLEEYWIQFLKPIDFQEKCIICKINKKNFLNINRGFSLVCHDLSCKGKYSNLFKKQINYNNNTYLSIDCKICHKSFNSILSLTSHLFGHQKNSCHNNIIKTAQQYYDTYILNQNSDIVCPICKKNRKFFKGINLGYAQTCKSRICIGNYGSTFSKKEIKRERIFKELLICKICNLEVEGMKGLSCHIQLNQNNHPTINNYYDQYLLIDENQKNCIYCHQPTKFHSLSVGYSKTCDSIECITKLIKETKHQNMSRIGSGYSKISIEKIFNPLIQKYQIPQDRCNHALLNREFYHYVGWIDKYKKMGIGCFSYDFCILDIDYKTPLLICEFQGTEFHLKKEEIWKRRNDKDFFGNSLIKSYRKDYEKKKYIREKYPNCVYIIIWEDDIQNGIFKLEKEIQLLFNISIKEPIILNGIRKKSLIPLNTECKICGLYFRNIRGLSSHLRQSHHFDSKEYQQYYDKYYMKENKICSVCKLKDRKFISFSYGYSSTCISETNCRFKWMNHCKSY